MANITIKLTKGNLSRTESAFAKAYPGQTVEDALKQHIKSTVANVEKSESVRTIEEQIKANKKNDILFD